MKRRSGWKQANPRDQLMAVLSAVQGNLDNIANGMVSRNHIPRLQKLVRQCQDIAATLDAGEWDITTEVFRNLAKQEKRICKSLSHTRTIA